MKKVRSRFKNVSQSVIDSGFGVNTILNSAASIKRSTVYRFYWGRGSVYKQAFHISIIILTLVVFITGLSNRVVVVGANSLANFDANIGNVDLLQQGSSLSSVLEINPSTNFQIYEHKVAEGESLDDIASKYGVSKDTVKWSNMDKYGDYTRYTEDKVFPGEVLRVPEVSGVLHDVKDGDNLDSILNTTSGDRFTVIEINRLTEPDYSLAGRKVVLVPEGRLNPPAKPAPAIPYIISTRPRPAAGDCGINGEINGIPLSNPLCHQQCAGYSWSRGFFWGHDGVDLSKGGGCPISAMCDGTVTRVGWENGGGGYTVRISCGNGIDTLFYHGDGNIWVSAGQSVSRGDPVMYMGSTGYSTGTHLHFIIRSGGVAVDPAYYVGY